MAVAFQPEKVKGLPLETAYYSRMLRPYPSKFSELR